MKLFRLLLLFFLTSISFAANAQVLDSALLLRWRNDFTAQYKFQKLSPAGIDTLFAEYRKPRYGLFDYENRNEDRKTLPEMSSMFTDTFRTRLSAEDLAQMQVAWELKHQEYAKQMRYEGETYKPKYECLRETKAKIQHKYTERLRAFWPQLDTILTETQRADLQVYWAYSLKKLQEKKVNILAEQSRFTLPYTPHLYTYWEFSLDLMMYYPSSRYVESISLSTIRSLNFISAIPMDNYLRVYATLEKELMDSTLSNKCGAGKIPPYYMREGNEREQDRILRTNALLYYIRDRYPDVRVQETAQTGIDSLSFHVLEAAKITIDDLINYSFLEDLDLNAFQISSEGIMQKFRTFGNFNQHSKTSWVKYVNFYMPETIEEKQGWLNGFNKPASRAKYRQLKNLPVYYSQSYRRESLELDVLLFIGNELLQFNITGEDIPNIPEALEKFLNCIHGWTNNNDK